MDRDGFTCFFVSHRGVYRSRRGQRLSPTKFHVGFSASSHTGATAVIGLCALFPECPKLGNTLPRESWAH